MRAILIGLRALFNIPFVLTLIITSAVVYVLILCAELISIIWIGSLLKIFAILFTIGLLLAYVASYLYEKDSVK